MFSANFRSIDDLDFSNLVGDIGSDDPLDFTTTDETEDGTVSRNKYGYPIQSDKWYTSYRNSDLRRA